MKSPRKFAAGLVGLVAAATVVATAIAATVTGPSSSQSPYLVPTAAGVTTKSIITTGDAVGGYRMVGIPDGLGAYKNGNGTFTLLMNHELTNAVGALRAHGAKGAFVSKWTIRKDDLKVLKGEDLIQQVALWNTTTKSYNAPAKGVAFSRFCSADLATVTAFWNPDTKTGYNGRILLNGEETGPEGRAFAHVLTGHESGTSYELPYLGKFSWENAVAHPGTGDTTVVIGQDDSTPGQIFVYVGTKRKSGNAVERAGLVGGKLYGVAVEGFVAETDSSYPGPGTKFSLVPLGLDGDVSGLTGAQIDADAVAKKVTGFQRPEDGSWNPHNLGTYYFATTRAIGFPSRLWRLAFEHPVLPTAGGTITAVLDGTEGQQMLDNLTIDDRGRIILQEDPGSGRLNGLTYVARVWAYDTASDTLTQIGQHDPARFDPAGASFLTEDEESSGVISASEILGDGWYLLDVQAHYATDAETVEGGQLLALYVPPAT